MGPFFQFFVARSIQNDTLSGAMTPVPYHLVPGAVRHGDGGKVGTYEFFPICGTTVRWKADLINRFVFAGGALDEPAAIPVVAEMYTEEALQWARIGCELAQTKAPDDAFRRAILLIEQIFFYILPLKQKMETGGRGTLH